MYSTLTVGVYYGGLSFSEYFATSRLDVCSMITEGANLFLYGHTVSKEGRAGCLNSISTGLTHSHTKCIVVRFLMFFPSFQLDYISFSAHTDYEQTSEFIRILKPPHVVRKSIHVDFHKHFLHIFIFTLFP